MMLTSPVRTLPSVVVMPWLGLARNATGYDAAQSMADIERYASVGQVFGDPS